MPTISGTVYDHTGAAAAGRIVRAYRRDTGAFLGQTTTGTGAVVPGDPSYANVSLLLHCDGDNGSTTFIDTSPSPKTVTAAGGAAISTAQSKFGGASASFFSAGSALNVSSSPAFDILSGDFTVELLVYYPNNPTTIFGFAIVARDTDNAGWQLRIKNGGGGFEWVYPGLAAAGPSASMAVNTWHHIAICRQGTQHYGGINGVVTAFAMDNRVSDVPAQISVGATNYLPSNNGVFSGYIDELRITKGVARYTANFTPPTAPFFDYAETPAVPLGTYTLDTGVYSGEVQRIVLDDDAGTLYNDLIDRVIVA